MKKKEALLFDRFQMDAILYLFVSTAAEDKINFSVRLMDDAHGIPAPPCGATTFGNDAEMLGIQKIAARCAETLIEKFTIKEAKQ